MKDYFLKNNYPLQKYFSILKSFLYSKFTDESTIQSVPKLVKYIKLPFYGKPSYHARKKIKKLLKNSFPSIDFRIILTNSSKISNFFNYKDRVPDSVISNLVYEFCCPDCESRYIGCSTRAFKVRVMEHIGKSHRTGAWLQKPPFSAIREHSHKYDHPFNMNDFKIISRFQNSTDTFIGESILIQKSNPDLNRTMQN